MIKMVKCDLNNGSCCISCQSCSATILNRINIIKKAISSFKDDGIEYMPISTVEYYISTIEKEIENEL